MMLVIWLGVMREMILKTDKYPCKQTKQNKMIPFILAAVGGYLIGDSVKSDTKMKFADGGQAGDEFIVEVFDDVPIGILKPARSKKMIEKMAKDDEGKKNLTARIRKMAHGGVMQAEMVSNCCSVKAKTEEDLLAEMCSKCKEHCEYVIVDADIKDEVKRNNYGKGGGVNNLEKELHRLQRDLNSNRLKLARQKDFIKTLLELLKKKDEVKRNNYGKGGGVGQRMEW